MPNVSIIIPVYNVEKYLKQCLDSAINQTLKDIEIICINDGSTDNSLKILNEYAQKDNRIKIINLKKNVGLGKARNIAFEYVTSPYVMYLHFTVLSFLCIELCNLKFLGIFLKN